MKAKGASDLEAEAGRTEGPFIEGGGTIARRL
ncbi:hypothetical protein SBA5_430062 [Candidatus Sulfotelmatomonas gaucii]|uniref:Uncharacterized protein n=1 Tax=Candidatus Sulfuritelmatomonas gaucii TaxID=2043161 RepID=A0A2N9LM62_9BACT|nr:hypothetical protein SBA5_430062 [Candidatus Sulfotelmatomonas gaucii]